MKTILPIVMFRLFVLTHMQNTTRRPFVKFNIFIYNKWLLDDNNGQEPGTL